MAQARVSGALPLAPADAWTVLSDLARFDEWLTIHNAWRSEIPDLGVGARITQQLTVMGMANVIDWTVDHFDPPAELRISGVGIAGAQIAFTLGVMPADGGASTVSIDAEFTGQMIQGAIGDAVERNTSLELQKSLANLQSLVG